MSNNHEYFIATAPPTLRQRRLSHAAIAVVLVAYGALAPFAATPLPQIAGFIPANEGLIFIAEFVTAVFLLVQFSVSGSRALLVLGTGYLFSALIVIPHALTFPGSFAPIVINGRQSAAWLYIFWHFGFFVAVARYALLKDGKRTDDAIRTSRLSAVCWSVTIVTGLVCALTWFVLTYDDLLPPLLNETMYSPLAHYAAGLDLLVGVVALFLLWVRQGSVLNQWLRVAVLSLISELALVSFFVEARFNLGFYAGHIFAVVSSTVVLTALLAESSGFYAQLLRTFKTVQRERESKLLNLQAVGGAIAHELNQPLSAIALEGNTALECLKRAPPDLEEVRVSLSAIIDGALHSSKVLGSIRDLFSANHHEMQAIDGNEIIVEALNLMREELKAHGITAHTELAPDLPRIPGHKGQLLQVILNLLLNAIEALESVDRDRVVRVGTKRRGRDEIAITVEDSGPGIPPGMFDNIFNAFVTTKRSGMGLGLSLCRMIIERHGGSIAASSGQGGGARFQIVLPTKPE